MMCGADSPLVRWAGAELAEDAEVAVAVGVATEVAAGVVAPSGCCCALGGALVTADGGVPQVESDWLAGLEMLPLTGSNDLIHTRKIKSVKFNKIKIFVCFANF